MSEETKLLGSTDPHPFTVINEDGKSNCLIICDHASNTVPAKLNKLGLSDDILEQHVGIDIGTEEIGRYLSQALDATMVMANYSRLVIDLNRGTDHPTSIPPVSDHIDIPGNVDMDPADKQGRIDEIYMPYHNAIEQACLNIRERGQLPFIISVHSFTNEMDGFKRPWEIGILWDDDDFVPKNVMANIAKMRPDFTVGDNKPYCIKESKLFNNTIERHAVQHGYPYIIPEFRQDLTSDPAKAEELAQIFLDAILPVIDHADSYRNIVG